MNRQEAINMIVELEWKQFDRARNEGGRASCQNDWSTFSIMRLSQYMTWPDELLSSYLQDLAEAENTGRNMVAEKYARMEEYTAPEKYAALKDMIPERSEYNRAVIDSIAAIQVGWMEAFAQEYPHLAANARNIHSYEDTLMQTSYETYLKGELGTYSDDTLKLYGGFIVSVYNAGGNLAHDIMLNTVKLYGYEDLASAEKANM